MNGHRYDEWIISPNELRRIMAITTQKAQIVIPDEDMQVALA